MFSTQITKFNHATPANLFTSTFEVKFRNLQFHPSSNGRQFVTENYEDSTHIDEDENTRPTISSNRYLFTKYEGESYWSTIDPETGVETDGPQRLTVIPTTYKVVTEHVSQIDNNPMEFKVTFGKSLCKVQRVVPGLDHIKLEYAITLTKKYFRFDNADIQEIGRLGLASTAHFELEEAEAFKVGIFMLALGGIGHKKRQQAQLAFLQAQEAEHIENEKRVNAEREAWMAAVGTQDSDEEGATDETTDEDTSTADGEDGEENGGDLMGFSTDNNVTETLGSATDAAQAGVFHPSSMVQDGIQGDGSDAMGFASGGGANDLSSMESNDNLTELDTAEDDTTVAAPAAGLGRFVPWSFLGFRYR